MKKTKSIFLTAFILSIAAPVFSADIKNYDNEYEYASYAKAIDMAKLRISNPKKSYDDQYEYASAAYSADLQFISRADPEFKENK
jgi:hypothetical protein